MKKFILLSLLYSVSLISEAQTFYQSPLLTNYLDNSINQSATAFWGEVPYNGIGKQFLVDHIPAGNYGVLLMPMTGESAFFTPMFARPIMNTGNHGSIAIKGSPTGEQELAVGGRVKIKRITVGLYGNGYRLEKEIDRNNDNFLDLPKRTRLLGMGSLNFHTGKWKSSNIFYYLDLDEQGGELDFVKKEDFQTTNAYGMGHNVQNMGFVTSHNLNLSKDKIIKNFYIRGNGKTHEQTSYYGYALHTAREQWLDGYIGFNHKKGLTKWEIGAKYSYQKNENTYASWNLNREEIAYGGYGQYETLLHKYLKLKAQLTVEKHNLLNWRYVPAIQLFSQAPRIGRYGIFAGADTRYTNILASNNTYFASGRQVVISENLNAEKGWYIGAGSIFNIPNLDFRFLNRRRYINFGAFNAVWRSGFYTNQIVADFISNPNQIAFYNLEGKAYRHSLELGSSVRFMKFTLDYLYRYQNAKITLDGTLKDLPFYSKNSWYGKLSYMLPKQTRVALRYFYQSSQYIPQTDTYSPNNTRLDLLATFSVRQWVKERAFNGMIIELGWQNLTNSRQQNLVVGGDTPFSAGFDAGQVWGNTMGTRIYGSLKYSF